MKDWFVSSTRSKVAGEEYYRKKDYKFCYSCDDQMFLEHAFLLVNAQDQELLILNLLIGECVLRIRGKLKNLASSVPMHQRRKRVEERRMFFERIDRKYKQSLSYGVNII
jgi:hypothetical protein